MLMQKTLVLNQQLQKGRLFIQTREEFRKLKLLVKVMKDTQIVERKNTLIKVVTSQKSKKKMDTMLNSDMTTISYESLKDSQAKQVFFKWNSNGKISELWSTGDAKATFKYDGDNMVFSQDVAGNSYAFSYDKSHNLTKVVYNHYRAKDVKEDAMIMEYEPKTFFVSKIIDRSGDAVSYKYGSNPKNAR